MKNFHFSWKNYRHIFWVLYLIPYTLWWSYLEKTIVTDFNLVHCSLDDHIPFCEYFIIPYLLWFLFIPTVWVFLFFADKKEFYRYIFVLYVGMTIFLIICSVYPNGLNLRVSYDPKKNIFTYLCYLIQSKDTPTNVFPSIHVFNSIAAQIAIMKSKHLGKNKALPYLTLLLTILICLSAMFLRQHSVLDVIGGIVMAFLLYWPAYKWIPFLRSEE